jgi:hypothetical protein
MLNNLRFSYLWLLHSSYSTQVLYINTAEVFWCYRSFLIVHKVGLHCNLIILCPFLNSFEVFTKRWCHVWLFAFLAGEQGEDHVLKNSLVAMVTSTPKPLVKSLFNNKTETSSTLIQVREGFAVTLYMMCRGTFNLICIKPLIIR